MALVCCRVVPAGWTLLLTLLLLLFTLVQVTSPHRPASDHSPTWTLTYHHSAGESEAGSGGISFQKAAGEGQGDTTTLRQKVNKETGENGTNKTQDTFSQARAHEKTMLAGADSVTPSEKNDWPVGDSPSAPTSSLPSVRRLIRHAERNEDGAEERRITKQSLEEGGVMHGTLWTNKNTLFVELVAMADSTMYQQHNFPNRIITSINVANAFLNQLGIVLVLKSVERSPFDASRNLDYTREALRQHLLDRHKDDGAKPDCTALFTRKFKILNSPAGQAIIGSMCSETSLAVIIDQDDPRQVGRVLAHEVGHVLSLKHDQDFDSCTCTAPIGSTCIMDANVGSEFDPTHIWSWCSKDKLSHARATNQLNCLKNLPSHPDPGLSRCGDGVTDVRRDEQCDCGPPEFCDNSCCNAETCQLAPNASCASGPCCDTQTCKLRAPGWKCRAALVECDLPEFCSGHSEYCPEDVTKLDGTRCRTDKGLCYKGECQSHEGQCQVVWGPYAGAAPNECFHHLNIKGNGDGNCGVGDRDNHYKACPPKYAMCGTLQCYTPHLYTPGLTIHRHNNTVTLGSHMCSSITASQYYHQDIWLTPNGVPCGLYKMCLDQRCVDVPPPTGDCSSMCSGHGICNSRNHCHCYSGYSPPNCSSSGYGGSLDSNVLNPLPDNSHGVRTAWIVLVLMMAALCLLCCSWGYIHGWWERWGRGCVTDRVPSCATCLDSCCCPFMNKTTHWLVTVKVPKKKNNSIKSVESADPTGDVHEALVCSVDVNVKGSSETNSWGVASNKLVTQVVTITPKSSPDLRRKVQLPSNSPVLKRKSTGEVTRPKYMQSVSVDSGCTSDTDDGSSKQSSLHMSMSSLISTFRNFSAKHSKSSADPEHRNSKIFENQKSFDLRRIVVDPLAGSRKSRQGTPPPDHIRPDYGRSISTDCNLTCKTRTPPLPPPARLKPHRSEENLLIPSPLTKNTFIQMDKENGHDSDNNNPIQMNKYNSNESVKNSNSNNKKKLVPSPPPASQKPTTTKPMKPSPLQDATQHDNNNETPARKKQLPLLPKQKPGSTAGSAQESTRGNVAERWPGSEKGRLRAAGTGITRARENCSTKDARGTPLSDGRKSTNKGTVTGVKDIAQSWLYCDVPSVVFVIAHFATSQTKVFAYSMPFGSTKLSPVPTWVWNTTCILIFISLVVFTSQLPEFPFTTSTARAKSRRDGQKPFDHSTTSSKNTGTKSSAGDAISEEGSQNSGNSRGNVEDIASGSSMGNSGWASVVVNVTTLPIINPHHHHKYPATDSPHTFQRMDKKMNITVELEVLSRLLILDLHPTRSLLTATYDQTNDSDVDQEDERRICEYQGEVRYETGSWAALSICKGLRGVIVVWGQQLLVTPLPGSSSLLQPHRILSAHLVPLPGQCGVTSSGVGMAVNHTQHTYTVSRRKRQRGVPSWVINTTRYVELVLVADRNFYLRHGNHTRSRCRAIINIVNAIYRSLDIVVMLNGLQIWKKKNKMEVFSDSYKNLENLKNYRETLKTVRPEWNNDNTILLSGLDFNGTILGLSIVAGMCDERFSVGVVQDIGEEVGLVAMVVAHELGHSLGFYHDEEVKGCRCNTHTCVMAGFRRSKYRPDISWSSCSKNKNLSHYQCLKNIPESRDSNCGDGVVDVEDGEECDCGPPEFCDNHCCVANTCKLASYATCAFGLCCNNETCQMKPQGEVCRSAVNDCDLEEFCSGVWHHCPSDVTKADGEQCNHNKGHCYKGVCGSHEGRCQELWGPDAGVSAPSCYQLNTMRFRYANCDFLDKSLRPCAPSDVWCGTLHCEVASERLPNLVVYQSGSTERDGHQCHFIFADRRLAASNWLSPDGASCGEAKMCVGHECVNVPPPTGDCSAGCSGRGVCNSLDHCHCSPGFGTPDCSSPGLGGSIDSGPMGLKEINATDISLEDVTPTP
ncbi:hypothetical protein Pcinc_029603 [Petrolisthes cinctipes]|uniref:Uncharacterized protein n=1 Tax=Petrolisthes cinctipes TaxID=88211 RepID=A0AAE1F0N0_PETCI|nr:hypothetical protein Pcinc_029603 [Petrolisthes cinctipes]